MTDSITDWLHAQLDEDERTARAATPGPWEQSGIGEYGWGVSFGAAGAGVEAADSDQGRADADHIAEHDPARVLREIEAKRQVVTGYVCAIQAVEDLTARREQLKAKGHDLLMTDMDLSTTIARRDTLHGVVRLLSLTYNDRPGYREEWRP